MCSYSGLRTPTWAACMSNGKDRQFFTSAADFWILETRKFHYATVWKLRAEILLTPYPLSRAILCSVVKPAIFER